MSQPYIWQPLQKQGTYIDLVTFLLENRIIFIGPEITTEVASQTAMQILALSQEKSPISLYINCHGGSVPAGLAIVDIINAISSDISVRTYCIGECIGVASAILVSGSPGERKGFPSARISLYQEWYGAESLWGARSQDSTERDRLMKIIQEIFTKRIEPQRLTPDRLTNYFSELAFLSGAEAIELGIIDGLY